MSYFWCFFFGYCFGMLVGGNMAASSAREQAVQAGVAQYVVDPKTGQTQFIYLERVEK